MSHKLEADQDNDAVVIGRYLHEHAYERKRKEVSLGHIKIDLIQNRQNRIILGEVKKSSRFQKSAEMQLSFYLMELKKLGVQAEGELLFPEEKKKIAIFLTPERENELNHVIDQIEQLIDRPRPPAAEKCRFCSRCAYQEFCWA
jgi:CRISPR-associated exonuclease Cas4